MRKALRNAPEEDPEFQIAPMIDVLLVLLVFFMSISTTEVLQTETGINLAVAKDATPPKKSGQVIVNVRWETSGDRGVVVVNGDDYQNVNDITPILQKAYDLDKNMRVLIRADRETKYEFTRNLMVAVSRAQIPNITFSVVDKEVPQ